MILLMIFLFVGCQDRTQEVSEETSTDEMEVPDDEQIFQFTEHYTVDMKGTTLNMYGVT